MDHIDALLEAAIHRKATDLYLTVGSAAALRIDDAIETIGAPLADADLDRYLSQLLTETQRAEFAAALEFNTAFLWQDLARFRLNIFRQQGHAGIVVRRIQMDIPSPDKLGLPALVGDLALLKRGLILIAGPTGSGKSTTMAAMIGHRNAHGSGHIITVEDPIEFVHPHGGCLITQRDVGLDTTSYAAALKNALRQRPDMVAIGEIRDREVMEQAIYFAETGHICLATLHANNANQTIERVLNFFPEERHQQIRMNLALNLRAVLAQRLVPNLKGTRSLALEVLLNNGLIRQLIEEGKVRQVREMIEKNRAEGMQTFDQCLMDMITAGTISEEAALAETDNASNLRMQLTNRKGLSKMQVHEITLAPGRRGAGGSSSEF